jgi:hypothetical protein
VISAVFETIVTAILCHQRGTLVTADMKPHFALNLIISPSLKHFSELSVCSVGQWTSKEKAILVVFFNFQQY